MIKTYSVPISPRFALALATAFSLFLLLNLSIAWLLIRGIGVWGVNIPVAWGMAIACFVWWIGIGHAGTFISAILLLLHQEWRTAINRFAEAMTLFAVACAGIYPLLHLGRPWFFYWLVPYPDTMGLWPQFRSPLVWDVFAIGTYLLVSLVFWYLGLVPDLATLRDHSDTKTKRLAYGFFALGWRGSAVHWRRYETAYLLLAGLATPLVVSVHSIVGMDFAASILPGWHSTFLSPYFVAGAIFSGFAMVLNIAIPLRRLKLDHGLITLDHLDKCAKLLLATGLMVDYSYVAESFMAWYGGNPFERHDALNRAFGPYAPVYWAMIAANVGATQLLWSSKNRRSPKRLFAIAFVIQLGMWCERFMIVVTSLHRDFLPSSWGMYAPTLWDWATFAGTLGFFALLFLLFVRTLPVVSIHENRGRL